MKFFIQRISWNTVSGSFHETWNTFTLLSNIHCVCFSSIKNCVSRETIPCKNIIERFRAKKFKNTKINLNETMLENQEWQNYMHNIFLELPLTILFRHYLGMNATSCFWSYIDFYTLITYNYILTDTYNSDEAPVLESLFYKVGSLQDCNVTKKDSYIGAFLWN